jgi:hypothetical protein
MDEEQLTSNQELFEDTPEVEALPSDMPVVESPTVETPPRRSRRRFLVGAAGGMAALVAAACGRSRSTPTPSPLPTVTATPTATQVAQSSLLPPPRGSYQSHLPWVANEGEAQAGFLVPEPTMTPTPPKITPTATAVPPTPTPQTTPFPPGPPSKLGLFVARNDPQIFEVLDSKGVAVLKTLELDANFVKQIKQHSPHTRIIGRLPDGDVAQVHLGDLDPLPAAAAYVERLVPLADDSSRRP